MTPALVVHIPHVRGQGRPRAFVRGGHARMHPDKRDGQYRGEAIVLIRQAMAEQGLAEPIAGPVILRVNVIMRRPKSVSQRKRPHPTVKPDLSNIIKSVEDALNGTAIVDDSQIVSLHAHKHYSSTDGVRVELERVES